MSICKINTFKILGKTNGYLPSISEELKLFAVKIIPKCSRELSYYWNSQEIIFQNYQEQFHWSIKGKWVETRIFLTII